MENWSDNPAEPFKVKIFLDTNILVYLVDDTYEGLNKSISFLSTLEFVDLVSSMFVIYEFVGVRKKEHYLKKAVATGKANISSLLKYQNDYSAPELDFDSVKSDLKQAIINDLEKIINDFGINYEDNILHNDLLRPTFDIFLLTKLSKEDSLVLLSSIFPNPSTKEKDIIFLSNDNGFIPKYKQHNVDEINGIYNNYNLNNPESHLIENINIDESSGKSINLINNGDFEDFWKEKISRKIIAKNKDIFLGKTFEPHNPKFPIDCISFKLKSDVALKSDIYITIIGKNLDFIYTTKHSITEFWHNTRLSKYPFQSNQKENISFKIIDDKLSTANISKMREDGNLVFYQEF